MTGCRWWGCSYAGSADIDAAGKDVRQAPQCARSAPRSANVIGCGTSQPATTMRDAAAAVMRGPQAGHEGGDPACPSARPATRPSLPRSRWRAPSARQRRTPDRHSSLGWLPARHDVSTVGKRQKDDHAGWLAASVPSGRDTTHKGAGAHLHGDSGGLLGHVAAGQVDGRCARARAECHLRRRAPAVNGRCCGRMRRSGGMMRPGAGNHFAGQHGHSGKPGDHPHPPRWPGPAAELGHILCRHVATSPLS
jgi:hypothetical protein